MKYHDNVVKLNLKKGELYEIDGKFGYFKVTELCITSGQDPDQKNKVGNVYPINENGEITFRVGRKGSSTVANWWKERIPANQTTFNHDPGDLNFAFIGELVLYVKASGISQNEDVKKIVTFENVGLAQGHAGASNNWWFGGKGMHYFANHKVTGNDMDDDIGLVALRGDNNVNEIEVQLRTYIPWISGLADETFVCEMSIPGTHDSGTSKLAKGPAHCQNFDIKQQLNDGIRFFDIRVGNDLHIWHGNYFRSPDTWDDVMHQMTTFLHINPKEFIIMLVGCENTNKWEENMKEAVKKYQNLYIQNFDAHSLKVKEVRGKIILLKRQDDCPCGKLLRFSDNTTFEYDGFMVEDAYNEHDTCKKLKIVTENLDLAKRNRHDYFFITFNSIAFLPHTPYQYAWGGLGIDPAMNIALADYLAKNRGKHTWGAILLDFYNDEGSSEQPVKDIINSNFDTPLLK